MLRLEYDAAPGVMVAYDPALIFIGGRSTVTVSVTPLPGTDALLRFALSAEPAALAGVTTNGLTVDVTAVEILSTVTLTVPDGLLRTVRSGQEALSIGVRLMAEYLGENEPAQTTLQLRAVGSNGVGALEAVMVGVPSAGLGAAELVLMLGAARQSTVSFEVVDLPGGVVFVSPQLRVELVPEPVSLSLSVRPQALEELQPRRTAVAEFRVRAEVQGSDGLPYSGLTDLSILATATTVIAGVAGDLVFSSLPLMETAPGSYESTLTVILAAGRVSAATVMLAVDGADISGLAGGSTVVQLARSQVLDRLELSLAATELQQSGVGASVRTTATVLVRDQFDRPFVPVGLRLALVDTTTDIEALLTEELRFDAGGEEQVPLVLTPRRRDQTLRVELRAVSDSVVGSTTATLRLSAAEALGSLILSGPNTTLTQTVSAESVSFDLRITAAGSKGTRPWQPSEVLRLQHSAAPGVMVVYDSTLTFSAGVATVTVTVTPLPGTDALLRFALSAEPAALAGVITNGLTVDVTAVEILSTVTLTVPDGLLRTVRSGQEALSIGVRLMAEYLGENEPAQTTLQLRAVGSNGVGALEAVMVGVPSAGLGAAELVLMLGAARQSTVSFEVVDLPGGVVFVSPQLRVELVPEPVSLSLSVRPQALEELQPRRTAVAEFRVRAEVRGSDGLPFGGLTELSVLATATTVIAGVAGDLVFSSLPLMETAPGSYESTLTVILAAGRVSAATLMLAVDGAGISDLVVGSTAVQLARSQVLDRLELSLAATELQQSGVGASVRTTATVLVRDQFDRPFVPVGLRLALVDTTTDIEALLTEELRFDAGGEEQVPLVLTPRRRDQTLRVELSGVSDSEVGSTTATLRLIAAEALGSLILSGPNTTLTQTVSAESVSFDLRITAAGSKGTRPWQPSEVLRLQHSAAPGVMVVYDSTLTFSAGVATVTVTVTPLPGTDAAITFSLSGDLDALVGVDSNRVVVAVSAAESLGRVILRIRMAPSSS